MYNFWDDGTLDFCSKYPSSVKSALACMNGKDYDQMTSDLSLDSIDSVIKMAKETNHLQIVDDAFVVWIDVQGKFKVKVWR